MKNKSILVVQRQRARQLRRSTTDAEKRLWRHLRTISLRGSHFRRQVPIGSYIADFACMAAHLIIELDGSQHANPANIEHDENRTYWLENQGFKVVRVWNNEITQNIGGVLEKIYTEIYGSGHAESTILKHLRRKRLPASHPTPARVARRPSPSRGG